MPGRGRREVVHGRAKGDGAFWRTLSASYSGRPRKDLDGHGGKVLSFLAPLSLPI